MRRAIAVITCRLLGHPGTQRITSGRYGIFACSRCHAYAEWATFKPEPMLSWREIAEWEQAHDRGGRRAGEAFVRGLSGVR